MTDRPADDIPPIVYCLINRHGNYHLTAKGDFAKWAAETDGDRVVEFVPRSDLDRARAEAEALRAVLKDVEWVADNRENCDFCPSCQNVESTGHAPGCPLASAIAGAEGRRP